MDALRRRFHSVKEDVKEKRTRDGWILPKQSTSWAPEGQWTNVDLDVTPPDRRRWTSLTILGYWISDILSVQSWETGSTILAVGLTWREAVLAIILGSSIMAVPMSLNGYTGAKTHVPFPVLARASFGYHFSKFPVVVRMITALFWHSITTYLAVPATTQVIRAIWPSYVDLKNHLPDSAGVTSQALVSYFVFWTIQFPILLIPPHKLRWFFVTKVVMVTATVVGMTIWISQRAGGTGDIWDQRAQVSGSTKSWLTMWAINSCTGSWSTVGVNIPDFTRYMRSPRSSYSQGLWFPIICSWIAIIGIVVTSASRPIYGDYIWDPVAIIATWDVSPAGRAAAFFAGLSWCVAQLGVNISANIISCANDMTSLFPKYVNIRRGAIITTIVGGWVMVPWKILSSASSLLNFMNSLGIFLSPIMAIQISDFFLIKRQAIDVPSLYRPEGRYRYNNRFGVNPRALIALLVSVGPNLPGMAYAVDPDAVDIGGAIYLFNMNWYYGFASAFLVNWLLNLAWPADGTLVPGMVDGTEVEGVVVGVGFQKEKEEENDLDARKGVSEVVVR